MASSGLEIPAIMYQIARIEGMYLETTVRDEKFQILLLNFKYIFHYIDYLRLDVMPCGLV